MRTPRASESKKLGQFVVPAAVPFPKSRIERQVLAAFTGGVAQLDQFGNRGAHRLAS